MENRENHGPAVHEDAALRAGKTEEAALCGDNEALDAAWDWLCAARKSAPADADIWDLRFHWETTRADFLQQLQAGEYRLSPMRVTGRNQQMMWTAGDALALKWLALRLQGRLPLHEHCEHVRGHGGGKSSVMRLSSAVQTGEYPWVCRTDIRGYYGAVDKALLLSQLKQHITRPAYLSLLEQYLYYSMEDGGVFHTPEKGIARGCALSPLMGALHLWAVDDYFARQKNIRYARYMDDFVILAKSRWSLRRQVKALNRRLSDFGFVKHPDKTFTGRVQRGFDWLGAWFTDGGVTGIAPRAVKNYHEKVRRLYERTQRWPKAEQVRRVSDYQHRWKRWAMTLAGTSLTTFMYTSAAVGAAANLPTTVKRGGSYLAEFNTAASSTTTTNNNSFPASCTTGSAISNKTGALWTGAANCLSATSMKWSANGLYFGYDVAPGVTLSIINAQSTAGAWLMETSSGPRAYYEGTITWDSQGRSVSSSPEQPGYAWTSGVAFTPAYFYNRSGTKSSVSAVGFVLLTVDDDAPLGTVNLPALIQVSQLMNNTISLAKRITITAADKCTINAPALIDFETVHITNSNDGDVLASRKGSFVVQCEGSESPRSASVTITGDKGRYTDTLKMSWVDSSVSMDTPAEIRGTIGAGKTPSCTSKVDGLIDFTGGVINLNDFYSGLNNIDYEFYLCSKGNFATGEMNAKATINVNWD